ncbi:MAG: M48 family metallopeptidase [Clostridia bacterium]|nr:M48 family metallopeptidase [Clostridia bacterium]
MQLMIDGIPVEVLRKSIKNMHLYVLPPDGRVRLTVPKRMARQEMEEFLQSRAAWIRKNRAGYAAAALPFEPERFETGERIWLWGRPLELVVEESSRSGVVLEGERVLLRVPAGADVERRRQTVRDWQRELLKEAIAERLPFWEARTGLSCSDWQVRHMTSRWGSCNVNRRKLNFNLQLVMHPPGCLDYVILHEVCHLQVADHGPLFKTLLDAYMPDWRRRKALLSGRG